jgi:hypothetical protein
MDWTNPDWMPEIGTRVAVNIGKIHATWAFGIVTRKTKKTFTIEVVKKTVANIRREYDYIGVEVKPDWDTPAPEGHNVLVARYKKCDETRREWRRTPSGWAVLVPMGTRFQRVPEPQRGLGRYKIHRFITEYSDEAQYEDGEDSEE